VHIQNKASCSQIACPIVYTKKLTFKGIAGLKGPITQVRERFVSELLGLFLAHDQRGGGTVGQVATVSRRVRTVRLDKSRSELGNRGDRRVALDAIFHRRTLVR
jgi:hypothetical protein